MKTATQNNVKSTNLTSKTFTIKTCAKAFEILSSGLYKDKITSITRELISNAYDAHIAAGIDQPIEVCLPSEIDHNIYFIDHGIGMSEEQIMNMYTTYFDSDKTDTNEQIGGFGLGSKSPFSYTNSFMVTSSKDGMKKQFLCFVNEEGPQITKLKEEPCNETGTTVSFVVKTLGYYSDKSLFRDAVRRIQNYNWDKPNLIKVNDESYFTDYEVHPVIEGVEGVYIKKHSYENNALRVRVGIFWYDVDASMLDEKASEIAKCLKNIIIDLNIGDIDLIASREGISYTKRTIEFLSKKVIEVQKKIASELQSVFKTKTRKSFLQYLQNNGLTWVNLKDFGYFIEQYDFCVFNLLIELMTKDGWNPIMPIKQSENARHLRATYLYVKKESENKKRFKDLVDSLNCEMGQILVVSIKDELYEKFLKSKWMEYFTTYKSAIENLEEKETTALKINEYCVSTGFEMKVNSFMKKKFDFKKDDEIIYVDIHRNKSYVPGLDVSSNVNERITETIDALCSNCRSKGKFKQPETIVYLTNMDKIKLQKIGCKLVNYFEWMAANNKKQLTRIMNMHYLKLRIKESNLTLLKNVMPILGDSVKAIKAISKYYVDAPWQGERLAEYLSTSPATQLLLTNNNIKYTNCDIDTLLKNVEYNEKKYENIIRLKNDGLSEKTKDLILKLI